MMIASVLCLTLLIGCKNKFPKFKICTTLEDKTFYCVDNRLPDEKNGKVYKYTPGFIVMPPEDFKTIYNYMIDREKYIMSLENRSCN